MWLEGFESFFTVSKLSALAVQHTARIDRESTALIVLADELRMKQVQLF
jgi:hypothetical protein